MPNPRKWDEVVNSIRWLAGKNPAGVPLDVADDVARAAMASRAQMVANPARVREVEMSPESAARLDAAVAGRPVMSDFDVGPLDSAPDFELGSPLWHQLDKGWRANDNLRRNRTPNLRNQNPELTRIAGQELNARNADAAASRAADAERAASTRSGLAELGAAAATVGVGAGLSSLYPSGESPAEADMTDTSGTADLVEESRPAPSVQAPAPKASPAEPTDYSFQARELMGKLNAMRRAAGGEVPEAKAMMAEINRLLELSNKQKNAPSYKPAMPTDYHGEAQRLLQDLNARRMEAGGEVADTQKVMAEVRRLQALGDRMRNAG